MTDSVADQCQYAEPDLLPGDFAVATKWFRECVGIWDPSGRAGLLPVLFPAAFAVVIIYALAWLVFDRERFDFNPVATLIVWVMTLFISRSNRCDTLVIHAKLDELLRSDENADAELATLDEKEPEAIVKHRDAEVRP